MRAFRARVKATDEESATTVLWEAGTLGIEVRPVGLEQAGEPSEIELVAYFPDATGLDSLRAVLPTAVIEPAEIPEVDWVARCREGFRAFRAGRFQVVPVWQLAESGARPEPRDVLIVDPGRAFGTGTHETTRLCLAALEDLAERRPLGRTLDLGAGTGILAIAAERLGGSPVVASDLDPEATGSSRLHARLNHAELRVVRADGGRGFRRGTFDLVLANLMALLLVDRAEEIRSLLAPGGALVLSGLLQEDVPLVKEAFARCGSPSQRDAGEWAALVYEGVR